MLYILVFLGGIACGAIIVFLYAVLVDSKFREELFNELERETNDL